jgi:hypothetical protein
MGAQEDGLMTYEDSYTIGIGLWIYFDNNDNTHKCALLPDSGKGLR